MAKPELEFFPVSAVRWTPVPGSAGPGLEERVLASDGRAATRILPVQTGLFASGRVEVSGNGLADGMTVGMPE